MTLTKDEKVALVHPCERCSGRGDYRCESREVGAKRLVKKKGVEVVEQPYVSFFLCEPCALDSLQAADPPRLVAILDHRAEEIRADTAKARASERRRMQDAQDRLFPLPPVGRPA